MGSISKNRTSLQALLLPTFLIHTTVPMPLSEKAAAHMLSSLLPPDCAA